MILIYFKISIRSKLFMSQKMHANQHRDKIRPEIVKKRLSERYTI